jgi:hypothetical protein
LKHQKYDSGNPDAQRKKQEEYSRQGWADRERTGKWLVCLICSEEAVTSGH